MYIITLWRSHAIEETVDIRQMSTVRTKNVICVTSNQMDESISNLWYLNFLGFLIIIKTIEEKSQIPHLKDKILIDGFTLI